MENIYNLKKDGRILVNMMGEEPLIMTSTSPDSAQVLITIAWEQVRNYLLSRTCNVASARRVSSHTRMTVRQRSPISDALGLYIPVGTII